MSRTVLIALVLLLGLSNCTKDKSKNACADSNCSAISFKADIIPIFTLNCATSTACHAGSNKVSLYLNLDSAVAYAQATQQGTGYVMDSNATNSILYNQLAPGVNDHMPQNGQLDDCDIQKIYCWIQQGALNN